MVTKFYDAIWCHWAKIWKLVSERVYNYNIIRLETVDFNSHFISATFTLLQTLTIHTIKNTYKSQQHGNLWTNKHILVISLSFLWPARLCQARVSTWLTMYRLSSLDTSIQNGLTETIVTNRTLIKITTLWLWCNINIVWGNQAEISLIHGIAVTVNKLDNGATAHFSGATMFGHITSICTDALFKPVLSNKALWSDVTGYRNLLKLEIKCKHLIFIYPDHFDITVRRRICLCNMQRCFVHKLWCYEINYGWNVISILSYDI